MRLIFTNMRADLAERNLAVGNARAKLETMDSELDADIERFLVTMAHVDAAIA
jgi:hypothetical protein